MSRGNREKYLKSFLPDAGSTSPPNGAIQRICWDNCKVLLYLPENVELRSISLVMKGEGQSVLGNWWWVILVNDCGKGWLPLVVWGCLGQSSASSWKEPKCRLWKTQSGWERVQGVSQTHASTIALSFLESLCPVWKASQGFLGYKVLIESVNQKWKKNNNPICKLVFLFP